MLLVIIVHYIREASDVGASDRHLHIHLAEKRALTAEC